MIRKKERLIIDSQTGGNGDIWMRLVSFYSISALFPDLEIQILIPPFLQNLSKFAFGNRLVFITEKDRHGAILTYTCLGFRDLIPKVLTGERYLSPYQRAVIHDKKTWQLKDILNVTLFTLSDFFGAIQVPQWKWITGYQGYLDIVTIKRLRKIRYEEFANQLKSDYSAIYSKLNRNIPVSQQLNIPKDLKDNVVVFPTGTSRQFIPVEWAKKQLPSVYYAFFYKDSEVVKYQQHGLKTIFFYHEPGDIIALSQNAKWAISTDSFSSHLLQSSCRNCTITITEVLKSRIISPAFQGKVVDAEAACHPCLHLDRKNHPTCASGYTECVNWTSPVYTMNVLNSIPS